MTTRNAEKEEKRRMQILQAAYDVIAQKGYNNFTIEDIANMAGLSKGGVLHYFKTKEDILVYLLEQMYRVIEDTIRKRSQKYRSAEKKLKAILIAFIVTAKGHPALYTVLVDFWAQIPINPRVQNIHAKIYSIICDEVRLTIDAGVQAGEFQPVDSKNTAFAVVGMIMNAAIQWTFHKELYNIDHVTKTSMSMVMAYLRKKGA
ncbi:MAG: TetR/AcrR family transcriptional regulator [Spirochaetes bacterium]|nr:MAG: TetR/AcrR family transcriptional regulator [Spirochaetota bacterium]